MIEFLEKHFLWLWSLVLCIFAGIFLGSEIAEMNMEKERMIDNKKLQNCVRQIAGAK